MPITINTIHGTINLEQENEGWFYSITTKDKYFIGGNEVPMSKEDAIESAKGILEHYELDPDYYRI